jgi:hypothetical protein
LVAALERFKLDEAARTDLAVETAGVMQARSTVSMAPRRSEAEASESEPALETVETQAGWNRVALQARRTASGAEPEDADAADGNGVPRWWRRVEGR